MKSSMHKWPCPLITTFPQPFAYTFFLHRSLGGNQRELARQKNAKKQQQKSKSANDKAGNKGAGLEQRKHRYHLTWCTSFLLFSLFQTSFFSLLALLSLFPPSPSLPPSLPLVPPFSFLFLCTQEMFTVVMKPIFSRLSSLAYIHTQIFLTFEPTDCVGQPSKPAFQDSLEKLLQPYNPFLILIQLPLS